MRPRPKSPPPRIRNAAEHRAFQRIMAAALFRPLTRANRIQSTASEGGSMRDHAGTFVKPGARLSSLERLEIYNRQYWFRVLDCLHDDLPALRALLGPRAFVRLCEAYLAQLPSESWTLRNLASRLVPFIEDHPELVQPHPSAAADLARLEWAEVVAFDSARLTPITADSLRDRDPAKLRLGLQPHLSLLELSHAADDFARAIKQQPIAGRTRSPRQALPPPAPVRIHLAVHRVDDSIYLKRLEPWSFQLLTALRDGQSLAAAVESALRDATPGTDWPALMRDAFENWAALGWFCAPARRTAAASSRYRQPQSPQS